MKLEVGQFVRTEKGTIAKIIEEIKDGRRKEFVLDRIVILNKRCTEIIRRTDKVTSSHNIIDLIEVGDVIVDEVGNKYPINYEFETDYNNEYESYEITIDDHITLFFKDGLSIVTKEQMEAMQYEVV